MRYQVKHNVPRLSVQLRRTDDITTDELFLLEEIAVKRFDPNGKRSKCTAIKS